MVLGLYAINAYDTGTADLPVGAAEPGCAAVALGCDS